MWINVNLAQKSCHYRCNISLILNRHTTHLSLSLCTTLIVKPNYITYLYLKVYHLYDDGICATYEYTTNHCEFVWCSFMFGGYDTGIYALNTFITHHLCVVFASQSARSINFYVHTHLPHWLSDICFVSFFSLRYAIRSPFLTFTYYSRDRFGKLKHTGGLCSLYSIVALSADDGIFIGLDKRTTCAVL